jgi:hypothetical protein
VQSDDGVFDDGTVVNLMSAFDVREHHVVSSAAT